MPDRPWPAAVDVLLGSCHRPVEPIGQDRWVVGSLQVIRLTAVQFGGEATDHGHFLHRVASVAEFAVPKVVGADGPWLVTEPPEGIPADRPDRHPQPGTLAGLIGSGLAALHALPPALLIGGGPTAGAGRDDADPWDPIVRRCRRRIEAGLVDSATLPSPYDRYTPERLLAMLVDGSVGVGGAADQPVLCHGRPSADRVLTDGSRFVGFDGLEAAVVADRHLDLATAHLSVAEVLGPEAVYAFYEAYGADPDLARLDRAVLAVHLLGPATRVR